MRKGWTFSVIDRTNEPESVKEKEEGSMPWKVAEAIRAAGGRVPKVFYETGAVGKEPVTVLVGSNPIEVAEQACEIARWQPVNRRSGRSTGRHSRRFSSTVSGSPTEP